MRNVLDVYRDDKLNYILPLENENDDSTFGKKAVVIIHLHYLSDINYYLNKVNNISDTIDIIITSSNIEVKKSLDLFMNKAGRKYKFILKENRGRDISAVLVACADEIKKYDYICFLHDKKANRNNSEEETKEWVDCIWNNLIGSHCLISNILHTFERQDKLGLLVPPIPLNKGFVYAYTNTWNLNYELARNIADRINIKNCNLNNEKTPITIGTAFWARREAIQKIINYQWKYEDFNEEPLENDGTISHAIERIWGYVAQDAGYYTGVVMNNKYAEAEFIKMQKLLETVDEAVYQLLGIRNLYDFGMIKLLDKKIADFIKGVDEIYIYGAGDIGKKCFMLLAENNRLPKAFVVTRKEDNQQMLRGIPVYELNEIKIKKDSRLIIAASRENQVKIIEKLEEKNIAKEQYLLL